MSAFPEVAGQPQDSTARLAFPEASGLAFPEVSGTPRPEAMPPAEGGFFESLPQVPEQMLRLVLSANPQLGGENVAHHVEDLVRAESGDQAAANRARAYQTSLSLAGSLTPAGPEVTLGAGAIKALGTRAALGALGGAIPAGAEAAAQGEDILPAAAKGAALGAVLNPLLGLGGSLVARKAAERLARAGKPVTPALARKLAAEVANDPQGPVERVTAALRAVPDLRRQQEALQTVERGVRIRRFAQAGQETFGEAGARQQLGTLAGKLPRVDFGSLRPIVDQADIDMMYEMGKASPLLGEWDRPKLFGALGKLFSETGTELPTTGELALMEKVYGSHFVETVLSKRPQIERMKALGLGLANTSRELMSSFDLSAPLRQGLFLGAGNPREFAGAFKAMLTTLRTEEGYKALEYQIASRPNYQRMLDGGLALSKSGSVVGQQEEVFMGNLARKIPLGVGAVVRGSENAYSGFLNKLRADVFDSMIRDAARAGHDINDPNLLRSVASYINTASGRGELKGLALRHAETLNALFFSPRLMASRIGLLNPTLYIRSNPIVRKNAIRSALALGSLAVTTLELAKLSGTEVETDIASPDWGKIRVGNTRYDILGGFQQYLRLGASIMRGAARGEGSGRVSGALQPTWPFLRNKLAPMPGLVVELFSGRAREGGPLNIPTAVLERFTPMVLQDTYQTVRDFGWAGVPAAVPGVFGVGVQTYGE